MLRDLITVPDGDERLDAHVKANDRPRSQGGLAVGRLDLEGNVPATRLPGHGGAQDVAMEPQSLPHAHPTHGRDVGVLPRPHGPCCVRS